MKVWKGTAKALARHHVYNNMLRDAKGRFIVPPCNATEARRICERYCKVKGGLFKFTTASVSGFSEKVYEAGVGRWAVDVWGYFGSGFGEGSDGIRDKIENLNRIVLDF